ncbi:MAG: efflux RND transporter permease subunit, partial [Hyphomicrobium sp.]
LTTDQVSDRLRARLAAVQGLKVFMRAAQDVRVGARSGKSTYQLTLWSLEIEELYQWVPKVVKQLEELPELVDVATDREQGGYQLNVVINRDAAARVGVHIQDIENALNNAFAQRQISTLYTSRNQYRVVLEIDPALQREPAHIGRIHVPSASGAQVPLSTLIRVVDGQAPLVVNHQGPFPAVTITYNVKTGVALQTATDAIGRAVAGMTLPENIRVEAAGEARAAAQQGATQPLIILAALVAVYIVLGVLYESLAHPLTIISTLPSAGLGALLALQATGRDLNLIGLIGVVLLIGIVKKNGIMLVDFALSAERERGLAPKEAIYQACLERFRPILMTTLAAVLGALPLALSAGPGSELRIPLGITIIGGLVVSQFLTLYTTPAIYLLLDRLHHRMWGRAAGVAQAHVPDVTRQEAG